MQKVIPLTPKVSDVNVDAIPATSIIYDEDVIEQTLDLLFSVSEGERLFMMDYGVDLEGLLFELETPEYQGVIMHKLITKVTEYAPFISIDWSGSKVTIDEYGVVNVRVKYSLSDKPNDSREYIRFLKVDR